MMMAYIGPDRVDLVRHKDYEVLGEEHGMYRVVDEDGEDFLYPKAWFR